MEFMGIAVSLLLAYLLRNKDLNRTLSFLFLYFAFSEVFKQTVLFKLNGYYDFWYFPFQLCSLPIYIIPLYFLTQKEYILNFLSDFCLLGGIFAFFDTSGMHYDLSILTANSYLWHYVLIYLGFFLKLNTKDNDFRYEIIIYLMCITVATAINLTFKDANMFYMSPYHKMNQLVFKEISNYSGQTFTKILYCFMQITGAYIINRICKFFSLICKNMSFFNQKLLK
ncbi:MAG: hypothetical protein ACI4WM_08685 [Erysipelotrichaceae bacterium]